MAADHKENKNSVWLRNLPHRVLFCVQSFALLSYCRHLFSQFALWAIYGAAHSKGLFCIVIEIALDIDERCSFVAAAAGQVA